MYNEFVGYLMFFTIFRQRALCKSSMGVKALIEQARNTGFAETLLSKDGDKLCVECTNGKFKYYVTHYHYWQHAA